jgi:hypothetical protein
LSVVPQTPPIDKATNPAPSAALIERALLDRRQTLFQAMGIIRLATHAIREAPYEGSNTDAWCSLDGAFGLLANVADHLENVDALIVAEMPHGDY